MKRLLAILLVLVMLLSLAACNGGSTTGTEGTTQEGKEATSGESEPIVLNYPCIWVGADSKAEVWGQMIEDFNKEYEGEIFIKIEEQTDYELYQDKLRTQIITGTPPDIFTVNTYADVVDFGKTGKMMDFSSLLAEEEINAVFPESALKKVDIDGVSPAIPFEMAVVPIMANQLILDEAGIDAFPTSYEELWPAFDKIKTLGVAPSAQMTLLNAWFSMMWYSYILAATGGADVYDKPLDDIAYVQAAEVLLEMFGDNTTSDAVLADHSVVNGHFFNGRTAFYSNGTWILGRIKSEGMPELYDNLTVSGGLSYNGQNQGAFVTSVQAYFGAAKQEDPEREEAVKTFFRYVLDSDKILDLANSSGAMFVVKIDSEGLEDPLAKAIVAKVNEAPFTIDYFTAAVSTKVANAFPSALEEMVLGDITPEEFAKKLKAADE